MGDADPYAAARRRMVESQLVARGIGDAALLEAMGRVPRERFVPEDLQNQAYDDHPLPIGHRATISQPYIVAFMIELAHVRAGDRVLDVGTGSGYQAAVLAELGVHVYGIDVVEPLVRGAKGPLQERYGDRVTLAVGDGYEGWPEHAPFDAIIVAAAPADVPSALEAQLVDGGRLVLPVGGDMAQQLVRLTKSGDRVEREVVLPVRFVPLVAPDAMPR